MSQPSEKGGESQNFFTIQIFKKKNRYEEEGTDVIYVIFFKIRNTYSKRVELKCKHRSLLSENFPDLNENSLNFHGFSESIAILVEKTVILSFEQFF